MSTTVRVWGKRFFTALGALSLLTGWSGASAWRWFQTEILGTRPDVPTWLTSDGFRTAFVIGGFFVLLVLLFLAFVERRRRSSGGARITAEGTVYKPEPKPKPLDVTSGEWIPQFRAYRGSHPEPGNDRGAASVGDYSTSQAAIDACRVYASSGLGPYWIEPIEFNGDVHAPVYRNVGAIELVDLGRDGWSAGCNVASAELSTGAGVFLEVQSASEAASHIRCRVFNASGQFFDARIGSVFGEPNWPATSHSVHYPYDFKAASRDPGTYETVWIGDLGDFIDPEEVVLEKSWFRIDRFGSFLCGP